jgi:hypothetical protein
MYRDKLIELQKIVDDKIGILKEEVEIGTNVKLNPIYIADLWYEYNFFNITIRIIQSILNWDIDYRPQFGSPKTRLEMMEMIEFEISIQERVQELTLKLKDCNNLQACYRETG